MRVTIDSAGRVVVPKALRDHLGIVGRAEVELEESGSEIVLRAVRSDVTLVERNGHLVLERRADAAPLDWAVVREMVERERR